MRGLFTTACSTKATLLLLAFKSCVCFPTQNLDVHPPTHTPAGRVLGTRRTPAPQLQSQALCTLHGPPPAQGASAQVQESHLQEPVLALTLLAVVVAAGRHPLLRLPAAAVLNLVPRVLLLLLLTAAGVVGCCLGGCPRRLLVTLQCWALTLP